MIFIPKSRGASPFNHLSNSLPILCIKSSYLRVAINIVVSNINKNDADKMNSQITTKHAMDYCSKKLTTGTTRQQQATTKRLRKEDEGRSQLHKLGKCARRKTPRILLIRPPKRVRSVCARLCLSVLVEPLTILMSCFVQSSANQDISCIC